LPSVSPPSSERVVQTEKGLRKEDSQKVHSLEAALQESQAELRAEKLLLHEVCLVPQTACLPVGLLASMPVTCWCARVCVWVAWMPVACLQCDGDKGLFAFVLLVDMHACRSVRLHS